MNMHILSYVLVSIHLHPKCRSLLIIRFKLITVKFLLVDLSNLLDLDSFFLALFFFFSWKSKVPYKVKAFVWLLALKRVNINAMLR